MRKKKNSILIVDNEMLVIKILIDILGKDYDLYLARNGAEAIDIVTKHMPDLILLDIILPGMDGYEVLTKLKSMDKVKEIPVIFITGLTGMQNEEKGLALSAADYIVKPFSAAIVKLRVGNQINIINHIRTIEQLSMTDQLTGIANRRSFEKSMGTEWGRAVRESEPISVLMIDIDYFKDYNDKYGHLQGDKALKTVAETLRRIPRRPQDILARYGGEEFVALLPNTDAEGAFELAEKMRKEVEGAEIPSVDGTPTKLTVSVGVDTQRPNAKTGMIEMLDRSDKALYEAKRLGRNRVCNYSVSRSSSIDLIAPT